MLLWLVAGLDLVIILFQLEAMFHYGTSQHRDFDSLYATRPIDSVPNLLCAVIALLVQSFLINRASALFDHHHLRQFCFVWTISGVALISFLAACGSFAVGISQSCDLAPLQPQS